MVKSNEIPAPAERTRFVTETPNRPDLSDFGNQTPLYATWVHVHVAGQMSRMFFGDKMLQGGEINYHTQINILTTDLVKVRDLLNELLPPKNGE